MPQLLLRQLPRELVTSVRDYARAHGLSTTEAGAELLARGLQAAGKDSTTVPAPPHETAGAVVRVP